MKAVNPCLTPAEARDIIKATADPINDAHLFPGMVGAGRINAYKAVKAAKEACGININGIITSDENYESPCNININAKIQNETNITLEARDEIYINIGFEIDASSSIEMNFNKLIDVPCK